jgi:hypothetical protein
METTANASAYSSDQKVADPKFQIDKGAAFLPKI